MRSNQTRICGFNSDTPQELAADIEGWVENWNENPTPFVWHKPAQQILERLAGYCAAINQDVTT